MTTKSPPAPHAFIRATSSPGGAARQFRVQYCADDGHTWNLYASFASREAAQDCLNGLLQRPHHARLVEGSVCPTAV